MKKIYHYCSCETLMSILSNKTIRMSNIRKSNDFNEIVAFLNIFRSALKTACNKFLKENPDTHPFVEFYENMNFDNVASAILNDSICYYATCFSEDGDLLSQWRGYAEDATGVSIGFNSDYIINWADNKRFKYMEINYDKQDAFETQVCYILKELGKTKATMDRNGYLEPSYYENAINIVINTFLYNAVFYKDASFSEEKEWRVVFYPLRKTQNYFIQQNFDQSYIDQLFYDKMNEFIQAEGVYYPFIRKQLSFKFDKKIIIYLLMLI